jgi:formylglycine-generating enzyme required for sulfatase activity/tetratricopeptide (TPR) repeat protein
MNSRVYRMLPCFTCFLLIQTSSTVFAQRFEKAPSDSETRLQSVAVTAAKIKFENGDFRGALELYDATITKIFTESLNRRVHLTDTACDAIMFSTLAVLETKGRDAAVERCKRLVDKAELIDNKSEVMGKLYCFLAKLQDGSPDDCLAAYRKAGDALRGNTSNDARALLLHAAFEQSVILVGLDRLKEAQDKAKEAVEVAKTFSPKQKSGTLAQLMEIDRRNGNDELAIQHGMESIALDTSNSLMTAQTYWNIGMAHLRRQQFEKARAAIAKASELIGKRTGDNSVDWLNIQHAWAVVLSVSNDEIKAEEIRRDIRTTMANVPRDELPPPLNRKRIIALTESKQFAAVEELLRESCIQDFHSQGVDSKRGLETLKELIRLLKSQGRNREAHALAFWLTKNDRDKVISHTSSSSSVTKVSASKEDARISTIKQSSVIVSVSTGMNLTFIPSGNFLMGSPKSEQDEFEEYGRHNFVERRLAADPTTAEKVTSREGPQHGVLISQAFYLGIYEVTQREYNAVMGRNPSSFSETGYLKNRVRGQDTGSFPVESVCWLDAIEFCNMMSVKDNIPAYYSIGNRRKNGKSQTADVSVVGGTGYRLPTEAEWEYACRGNTKSAFHFGDSLNGEKANVNGNYPSGTKVKGPNLDRSNKVGAYPGNSFGLHDMHGNVAEWCFDVFDSSAYRRRDSNSVDPIAIEVSGGNQDRVIRGGSWGTDAWYNRSAYRESSPPDGATSFCGFRVARTIFHDKGRRQAK